MKKFGNVDSFLNRFKDLAIPNERTRKGLAEIINVETGVNLSFGDIAVRNSVAYIKCGAAAKSEIFLKKQEIMKKLNSMEGAEKIKEIR